VHVGAPEAEGVPGELDEEQVWSGRLMACGGAGAGAGGTGVGGVPS
jgi:hypothetical protein